MTTTHYGQSELSKLRPRRNGELYTILAEMVPIAWPSSPTPGVMELALIGFTSTVTGWTEDTADATDPRRRAPFHEIGIFNVPAGPVAGPAPNPDPNAPNNAWAHLAGSQLVRRLLGHAATTVPGAWKTAHRDQVAVGIADQLGYDAGVQAHFHHVVWDPLRVGLMFGGFTVGPGGVIAALRDYTLTTWAALRADVVARQDARAARVVFSGEAKLESARVVAEATLLAADHAFLAWWQDDRPTDTAQAVTLARLAASAHPRAASSPTAASGSDSGSGGAIVAAALAILLLASLARIGD